MDIPIVEWLEHVEMVFELSALDRMEPTPPLRLPGFALAVYRQLSQEQKMDLEEIMRALMTAYSMDAFNAFDEFTAQRPRQNETVDEFLADLHHLTRLVGEPLPERWMICACVSGLPQHVRQLLWPSSRMETLTLEQLLTWARAVMTYNQGQIDPIVVAAQTSRSNVRNFPKLDPRTSIVSYNCNGQSHLT